MCISHLFSRVWTNPVSRAWLLFLVLTHVGWLAGLVGFTDLFLGGWCSVDSRDKFLLFGGGWTRLRLGLAFLLSLLGRPLPVRPSTISRINLNLTRKVLHMTYQARLMQASRRTMEKRIMQTLKMMSRANKESIFDLHYRTGKIFRKCTNRF